MTLRFGIFLPPFADFAEPNRVVGIGSIRWWARLARFWAVGIFVGVAALTPTASGAAPEGASTSNNQDSYWLVAADDGVFAFGSAQFYGSSVGSTATLP